MEAWRNGKQQFLEVFEKAYNEIGQHIATGETALSSLGYPADFETIEVDHENTTSIDRERLRMLREKAALSEELEDQVSILARQKRSLGARINDRLLARNDENERLIAENTRLTEELEKYAGTTAKVDELEKENQRLATELKQSLQRVQDLEKIAGTGKEDGSTTGLHIQNSSMRRIDQNDLEPVSKETHRALVTKYNTLYENWIELKAARKQLDNQIREERAKSKKWSEYCDGLEKDMARKKDKTQRLEEDLRELRERLSRSSTVEVSSSRSTLPVIDATIRKPNADPGRKIRSGPAQNVHQDEGNASFEGVITAPEYLTVEEIMRTGGRNAFLNGASPKKSNISPASPEARRPSEVAAGPRQPDTSADFYPNSSELPTLLGGGADEDANVQETYFVPLEPHNSDSTETDPDPADNIVDQTSVVKAEHCAENLMSHETPVVISARSVRKKRGRNATAEASPVSKIKVETISSSPLGLAALHGLDPNESMDLDEIGDKQVTPRKQRPVRVLPPGRDQGRRYRSESLDHSYPNNGSGSENRSQSTPLRAEVTGRKESTLRPLSTNKQILPRTSDERASKRRRVASDEAVGEVVEDGEIGCTSNEFPSKEISPEVARRLSNLLDKPSPVKNPLKPGLLSLLNQSLAHKPKVATTLNRAYDPDSWDESDEPAFNERILTDDVRNASRRETVYTSMDSTRRTTKRTPRTPVEPARLSSRDTFKDSAYGSRPNSRDAPHTSIQKTKILTHAPVSEKPRPTTRGPLRSSTETPTPLLRGKAKEPIVYGKTSVAKRKSRGAEEVFNAENDHPDNEPLRARPLEKLSLQDFKVNPNYNQGYDYAFTDVVRNQADRRCLQGCTKPECCGNKFRALADLARDPNITPTSSQEEADQILLDDFLGDNAYKLNNMTKDERDEVLLQARTKQMSDKYGRHRNAYERRQSPPGFWNIDFPNTQEAREEAEKARVYERGLVERRYREAMRRGAYIFRDE